MRILVTGASGFVGGAVVAHLVETGHDVTGLVRREEDEARVTALGAKTALFDLGSPRTIHDAAAGHDVLIHAAGTSSTRASPRALGWIHVAGTENTLRAAAHAGVRRFVHISCADVTLTGEPRMNWSEDHHTARDPIDALGRTKKLAEEAVLAAGRASFETVVLRPAIVWGPGDRTLLPSLCEEALHGGIRILGRGLSFMATTYIGNLALAVELAAHASLARGGVYYITDREVTAQRAFFDRLSSALDLPAPVRGRSLRIERWLARARETFGASNGFYVGDVLRRALTSSFDTRRARSDLGYEARFTQEEGMAALEAWARAIGGPKAIIATRRTPPSDRDVAHQIELATAAE